MWADAMQAIQDRLDPIDFVEPTDESVNGIPTTVPSTSGMSVDTAESTLEQAGFNPIDGGSTDSGNPAGTVAYTEPVRRLDRCPRAPSSRSTSPTGSAPKKDNGEGQGQRQRRPRRPAAAAAAAERRRGRQAPSWRRTSAATAPPSARPLTWGCTTPITLPIAFMPSPAAPTCATAAVTRSAISCVAELRGQVVGDHGRLGALLGGHLGAAAVGERGRGLAALLGLAWRARR